MNAVEGGSSETFDQKLFGRQAFGQHSRKRLSAKWQRGAQKLTGEDLKVVRVKFQL